MNRLYVNAILLYGRNLEAQMVKNLPAMQKTQVWSLGREGPWRRKWQSTPVLLPGKSYGQRSLVGYSSWGRKESDTTERLHFPYGFLQARILELVAMPSSRGSSQPRDRTCISCIGRGVLPWFFATREAQEFLRIPDRTFSSPLFNICKPLKINRDGLGSGRRISGATLLVL